VKKDPRMPEQQWRSANFSFLAVYDVQLVRFGALAERYFGEDPATCLIKLRQYGETLAQLVAAKAGLFRDTQAHLQHLWKCES
jgi:type I restriction enzyme, R subunit